MRKHHYFELDGRHIAQALTYNITYILFLLLPAIYFRAAECVGARRRFTNLVRGR